MRTLSRRTQVSTRQGFQETVAGQAQVTAELTSGENAPLSPDPNTTSENPPSPPDHVRRVWTKHGGPSITPLITAGSGRGERDPDTRELWLGGHITLSHSQERPARQVPRIRPLEPGTGK